MFFCSSTSMSGSISINAEKEKPRNALLIALVWQTLVTSALCSYILKACYGNVFFFIVHCLYILNLFNRKVLYTNFLLALKKKKKIKQYF